MDIDPGPISGVLYKAIYIVLRLLMNIVPGNSEADILIVGIFAPVIELILMPLFVFAQMLSSIGL